MLEHLEDDPAPVERDCRGIVLQQAIRGTAGLTPAGKERGGTHCDLEPTGRRAWSYWRCASPAAALPTGVKEGSRHMAPLDSSASGRKGNRGTTALSSAGESWRSIISAHSSCARKRRARRRVLAARVARGHEATIQRHERHGPMHAIVSKPCNRLDARQY
jgi:hypothetical protein